MCLGSFSSPGRSARCFVPVELGNRGDEGILSKTTVFTENQARDMAGEASSLQSRLPLAPPAMLSVKRFCPVWSTALAVLCSRPATTEGDTKSAFTHSAGQHVDD